MSDQDVKLLGALVSLFVIRTRLALYLKGIQYEFLVEDLKNKSELLLKSNPVHKKVHVLIHNGKPVSESLIIIQYIDEAWLGVGPNIMSCEPLKRSNERFMAQYVDEKFLPAMFGVLRAKSEDEKKESLEKTMSALQTLEAEFERVSIGKDFFGCERIGYIDLALGSYVEWIATVEQVCDVQILDDLKIPHLVKWAEKFREVDVVKEVVAEKEAYVRHAKKLQAMFNAQAA